MGNGYSSYINVSHDDLKNNIYGQIVYNYATSFDPVLILKAANEIEEGEKNVLPFYQENYYSSFTNYIDFYVNETILKNLDNYNKFMVYLTKEFKINKKHENRQELVQKKSNYSSQQHQQMQQTTQQMPQITRESPKRDRDREKLRARDQEPEPEPEPEPDQTYFEDYEEEVKPKKQQQTRDDQYEIKPKQTKNKINKKIKELNKNINREKKNNGRSAIADLYNSYEHESVATAEGEYDQESV